MDFFPEGGLGSRRRRPLREEVFEALQAAILSGRFQPGDLIREVPLAQELGVSQNTIREVLLHIERLGLVVRTPNRHTAVTRLSDADIAERVSLRILLEPKAALAAAHRMTAGDLAGLEARLRAMNEAVAGNAPIDAARADYAFHNYIWEKSGMPWICRVLEQTTLPLLAFVSMVRYRRSDDLRLVVNPHSEILDAIRSGDARTITRVFRQHLQDSYREFVPRGFGLLDGNGPAGEGE